MSDWPYRKMVRVIAIRTGFKGSTPASLTGYPFRLHMS
jgi:hypothetical protein